MRLVAEALSAASASAPGAGGGGGDHHRVGSPSSSFPPAFSSSPSSAFSVEMALGSGMCLPVFATILSCLAECRSVIAVAGGDPRVVSQAMQTQIEVGPHRRAFHNGSVLAFSSASRLFAFASFSRGAKERQGD